MTPERRERLIALAKSRRDLLALAVLEADRRYRPVDDYRIFVSRLRRIA